MEKTYIIKILKLLNDLIFYLIYLYGLKIFLTMLKIRNFEEQNKIACIKFGENTFFETIICSRNTFDNL